MGPATGGTDAHWFPIELGKVREFARATKAVARPFYEDAAPVVPPTYLTVAGYWTPPDRGVLSRLDLDWSRLLHGGSRFVFRGPPPRAGDELWVSHRLERIRTKNGRRGGRMRLIEFVVDFADRSGALVAQEFHTTIETASPPGATRRPAGRVASVEVGSGEHDPVVLPPLIDNPVTRTDIVRYQGASGDLNPIHHDDEYAQRAGYPSAFSVGMLHAGILGSYVASCFGAECVRELGIRFLHQVWPGDVLTYTGSIRSASSGRLELDVRVVGPAGTQLVGTATVVGAHDRLTSQPGLDRGG